MSVQPATLKDYVRRLGEFWVFVEDGDLDVGDESTADAALTEFANFLYKSGKVVGEGERLKAALEAAFPQYSRVGTRRLPCLARSLKSWKRSTPS